MEQKLSEVHRERVSTMDDVCELLSDIPAKDLTSLFGISASHMQRKLAKRYVVLKCCCFIENHFSHSESSY